MKPYSTIFLKIAVILIGIPVLALCIFWLPNLLMKTSELKPEYASFRYVLIGVYISALPFFFALYQALKLLRYIDKNKAFSELSVKALKYIKYCANTISIIYVVLIPLVFAIADADDAPGLLGIPLIIVFASIAVAVFAAVLQRLLQDAIDIKSENDLTV
jgi:hypothetical protein